jgi:hypothetical protein
MRMLLTLSAIALTLASSGNAATVIPVGEFRSVTLSHGGRVVVRHGAVQRVSLIAGTGGVRRFVSPMVIGWSSTTPDERRVPIAIARNSRS